MHDEKNRLRSFYEFKKASFPIIQEYNVNWLKTEYSTAVRRARETRKFKDFERDADVFPNLKWLPSTSIEKRKSHEAFYNLIKPINDTFWATHFPGNLWNCKCGITNTDEPASLTTPKAGYDADAGLEENPAFSGKVFTDTNPYKKEAYVSEKKLDAIAEKQANRVAYKPEIVKEYKNGGQIIESNLVKKSDVDYKDISDIAVLFAKDGAKVEIMPKFNVKNPLYEQLVYPKNSKYYRKNPDLKINNELFEFESYTGEWSKNKINNMLSKGSKQADKIIIDLRTGTQPEHYIKKIVREMNKNGAGIKEVWIYQEQVTRLI